MDDTAFKSARTFCVRHISRYASSLENSDFVASPDRSSNSAPPLGPNFSNLLDTASSDDVAELSDELLAKLAMGTGTSPVRLFRRIGLERFCTVWGYRLPEFVEECTNSQADGANDDLHFERIGLGWLCRSAVNTEQYLRTRQSTGSEFEAALRLCKARPSPLALVALRRVYQTFHLGQAEQLKQLSVLFGQQRYYDATPWLLTLLEWTPGAACDALGRCGDERAVPELERLADKFFGSGDDKRAARAALDAIRERSAAANASGGLALADVDGRGELSVADE